MVVLEARVDSLEEKVARLIPLEAEVKQMRENWQAIHASQSERLIDVRVALNDHHRVLVKVWKTQLEHTTAINDLRQTQLEQGQVLHEHTTAINDLRKTQLEHTTAISDLRTEFGEFREEVRHDFAEIARSLAHLINGQGQPLGQPQS